MDYLFDECDAWDKDEITCPYCGDEGGDSWEIKEENGEEICYRCKKKFKWERYVSVSYNSFRIEDESQNPSEKTSL